MLNYQLLKRFSGSLVLFATAIVLGACGGGGSGATTPPSTGGGSGSQPQVDLTARESLVDQGQSTVLQWSTSGASECLASGGWSGTRALSGSATVGPISEETTYSLSCSGSGGSTMAMISVQVKGTVTLSWQPPALREDGTQLDDSLAGYRVYYGAFSRNYTDSISIMNPQVTQQSFRLPSGQYYFAMTAIDRDGLESDHSNEVTRRVN